MSSIAAVLKSSANQAARTPDWLLERLKDVHFGGRQPFDPCPAEPVHDGLAIPWEVETFVNPPFNELPRWVAKAVAEGEAGRHVVLLMPARVSAKYFHQVLLPSARSITIWCQPVTFPPFKAPFSLPILTVEFGGCNGSRAPFKPIAATSVWQPGLSVEGLRAMASDRFPGAAFVPLFQGVAEGCRRVAAAAEETVLLMPPWFCSAYFRALLPRVTEVVFLGPRPKWTAGGSVSLLGSALVHVAAAADWTGGRDALYFQATSLM